MRFQIYTLPNSKYSINHIYSKTYRKRIFQLRVDNINSNVIGKNFRDIL